jgi:hypothetical protein
MNKTISNMNSMKKSILLMTFVFLGIKCQCQEIKLINPKCVKCKIEYINEVRDRIDSLNYQIVLNFLCTIDKKCENNAEFSEYSNETLFMVLSKKPNWVIDILDKYNLAKEYILENLGTPVNDGINVEEVRTMVEKVKTKSSTKSKILNALKVPK